MKTLSKLHCYWLAFYEYGIWPLWWFRFRLRVWLYWHFACRTAVAMWKGRYDD